MDGEVPARDNCLSLHPIYLQFSDAQLERRYIHDRNHHLSLCYDEAAWWIHATMNVVGFIFMVEADPDCWRLVRLLCMAMLLQQLTFRLISKATYRTYRQPLVIAFRIFYSLATLRAQPECCEAKDWPPAFGLAKKSPYNDLFWHSNITGILWYTVALPLTLRNHLITQSAQVLLWGLLVNPDLCRRVILDPAQSWWLQGGWHLISHIAHDLLAAMVYPLHSKQFLSDTNAHTRCTVIIWYLQLAVGLVGTSVVVYVLELGCRRRFLRGVGEGVAAAQQHCCSGWRLVYVVVLVLLGLWLLVVHLLVG